MKIASGCGEAHKLNHSQAPLRGYRREQVLICLGSVQTVIVQDGHQPRFRRPIRLVHLAKEGWVLNPLGCGYRAALEAAMGERSGTLHVTIDTYGTDDQLRMVAAGRGLALCPTAPFGPRRSVTISVSST